MKKILFYGAFLLAAPAMLTNCAKEDGPSTSTEGNSALFDFATTKTGDLTVNYALKGYEATSSHTDWSILLEVYAENPWDATNNVRRTDLKPLFAANLPANGRISGKINLPTYLTSVFLSTNDHVAHDVIEVPVVGGNVSYDASAPVAMTAKSSRAPITHTLPDNTYYALADWDENGVPANLVKGQDGQPVAGAPAGLLTDIRKVLWPGRHLNEFAPYLVPDTEGAYPNHNINLKEEAGVEFIFLTSSASWNNALAYYYYPTPGFRNSDGTVNGAAPTDASQITRKTMIFPWVAGSGHPLKSGNRVKLQYWNGTQYVDNFPAGTSIGFILLPNSYIPTTGNVVKGSTYGNQATVVYSDAHLNYGQMQQSVALYNEPRELIVIGFEDRTRATVSQYNDHDFDDAIFYVEASPFSAIDKPGDHKDDDLNPGTPDPEPKGYELEYEGTLAFEDLWPWRGDYDMNDVGLTYSSKVYYNAKNEIYRTEDTFTPVCKGGQHTNGFGFQYGVTTSLVKSCKVTATPGAPVYSYDKIAGTDLEAGQSKAVVMLFGDVKTQLTGTASDKDKSTQVSLYSYDIVTELNNVSAAELGFPPYNPFIIVQPAGTSEDPRAREIHLTNMAPTDKGLDPDNHWFGKGHDKSNRVNYWYISDWSFPFAINIPTKNWVFPNENQRVDAAYSRFANWANTLGEQDADWWKQQ